MTTNRVYLLVFGVPLLAMVVMGAIFSGGDLKATVFFAEVGVVAVGLIAIISLPLIAWHNRWQWAPLAELAEKVGGEVVKTIGGDSHLRIPQADGSTTLVFWLDTQEEFASEDRVAWTCVGRERGGREAPAVEVRLFPDGKRAVRWASRVREELSGEPEDPLETTAAREAAELLASFSPGVESRIRYEGDRVVFALRGTHKDPKVLGILAMAAGQVLDRL